MLCYVTVPFKLYHTLISHINKTPHGSGSKVRRRGVSMAFRAYLNSQKKKSLTVATATLVNMAIVYSNMSKNLLNYFANRRFSHCQLVLYPRRLFVVLGGRITVWSGVFSSAKEHICYGNASGFFLLPTQCSFSHKGESLLGGSISVGNQSPLAYWRF